MLLDFNPQEYPSNAPMGPLKLEWAILRIVDVKEEKEGVRTIKRKLRIVFEVVMKDATDRMLCYRCVYLDGHSAEAQSRSAQFLADLCRILGIERLFNSDQLIGRMCVAHLTHSVSGYVPNMFRAACPTDFERLREGLPIMEDYGDATTSNRSETEKIV